MYYAQIMNVKIQMATEEQKYLSDIIKNTHATLRQEAQNCGPEIAWERHIRRKDILQVFKYYLLISNIK